MSRYFKYLLLGTFLSALLVIVLLQFNSNRSMNQLIDGNEDLLEELNIKNDIQQLQTGIVTLENKVKSTVIEGRPVATNHLQQEIANIQLSLTRLDTLRSDNMIAPLITQLNNLVNEKISLNKRVLDTLRINGKTAAEIFINKKYGTPLTDSIKLTARQIDDLHQLDVTDIIQTADNSGRKAKTLGTIMSLIATIASIFTFGYVAYKVREQQVLIAKLNASEKKVRDAARVKENFLANMSHEIRTPLNAILGFTGLLHKKELDKDAKEYVQTISKSGENLLTIVNDILDLSKIEAGMMRIENAPFGLRALLDAILTMFKTKADEKQLILNVSAADDVPDRLEGDATRLTQVLVNLVGNALKFTHKGSIQLSITNNGTVADKITLGITISDTGIGIDKEQQLHIFERFQQAEESVTRRYGGTGLGLSIVYDLVQLQDGTIAVESKPGEGTMFKLMIPYKISPQQFVSNIQPFEAKNIPAVADDIKVLIVEDNEFNQNLLKHFFSNWQLLFDIANNGRQALQLLKDKEYDLILMDIQMPEMDGYTATQEIRNSLHLQTPVIALTAHALEGEKQKCLGFGMNDYIAKPIREKELYELVMRYTGSKKLIGLAPHDSIANEHYQHINLSYMREVSRGNIDYEKTVTEQFIEAIPEELNKIEKAWNQKDIAQVKQLAHNMKTTVSVMGLNEKLRPCLDALEYEQLSNESFQKNYETLVVFCEQSLQEAGEFYSSLIS